MSKIKPTCHQVHRVPVDVQSWPFLSRRPAETHRVPLRRLELNLRGRPLCAKQPHHQIARLAPQAQLNVLGIRMTVHEGGPRRLTQLLDVEDENIFFCPFVNVCIKVNVGQTLGLRLPRTSDWNTPWTPAALGRRRGALTSSGCTWGLDQPPSPTDWAEGLRTGADDGEWIINMQRCEEEL